MSLYLIQDFRPRVCYNVNSHAVWRLYKKFGRGLSKLCSLQANLFCYDFDDLGQKGGYAVDYLPETIEHLTAIYLDNETFRRTLIEDFGLSPSLAVKLRVLYQPMKDFGRRIDRTKMHHRLIRPASRRRQVMWAGRLDRQKRPDIMLEIAKRLPEIDFHVMGGSVLSRDDTPWHKMATSNVKFHGPYNEFFDLPLEEFDLYLYTSSWDGLPLVLIDVMQAGLPVVAPDVGGVAELVNHETGWLVNRDDDVAGYVQAIRHCLSDPETTCRKLDAGQRLVRWQHNWTRYGKALVEGKSIPAERASVA